MKDYQGDRVLSDDLDDGILVDGHNFFFEEMNPNNYLGRKYINSF